jgi:hypothetical protein
MAKKVRSSRQTVRGNYSATSVSGNSTVSVNYHGPVTIHQQEAEENPSGIKGGPVQKSSGDHASYGTKLRVLMSYDQQDPVALTIVEKLSRQLADSSFELLLAPQDTIDNPCWRDDLYTVAGLSHAAILFLSPGAHNSDVVYKAACLLAIRTLFRVEIYQQFILIPVLLEPVTLESLCSSESKFAPLQLEKYAPLQVGSDPDQVCAHVNDRLKYLIGSKYHITSLDGIGKHIGQMMRSMHIDDTTLQQLADDMQRSIDAGFDASIQVGWALWNIHLDKVYTIKDYLDLLFSVSFEQKQQFMHLISPGWVNPWSACWFPLVAQRIPGQRAVVINGRDRFIVDSFIRRAYCKVDVHSMKVIDLHRTSDGDGLDSLVTRVFVGLYECFKYQQPPSYMELEKRLESYINTSGPVFVILELYTPEEVHNLMQIFKFVTFVFLTDRELPENAHIYTDVHFLQPPLNDREFDAGDIYLI